MLKVGFFDLIRVCTDQLVTHNFVPLANQISRRRGFLLDYTHTIEPA